MCFIAFGGSQEGFGKMTEITDLFKTEKELLQESIHNQFVKVMYDDFGIDEVPNPVEVNLVEPPVFGPSGKEIMEGGIFYFGDIGDKKIEITTPFLISDELKNPL